MKFVNPTKYLVSFNVARLLVDGTKVSKWHNIEPGCSFETEDKEVIEVAMRQTEAQRTMEALKGYLVVEDKNPVGRPKKY